MRFARLSLTLLFLQLGSAEANSEGPTSEKAQQDQRFSQCAVVNCFGSNTAASSATSF